MAAPGVPGHDDLALHRLVDRAGAHRDPVLVQLRAVAQYVAGLLVPVVVGRPGRLAVARPLAPSGHGEQPRARRPDDAHRHPARRRPGPRARPLARAGRPGLEPVDARTALDARDRDGGDAVPRLRQPLHGDPARPTGDAARSRHVLGVVRRDHRSRAAAHDRPRPRGGRPGPRRDSAAGAAHDRAAAARPGDLRQPDDRVRHVDRRLRDLGVPVRRRVERDGADQDLLQRARLAHPRSQRPRRGHARRDGRGDRAGRRRARRCSAEGSAARRSRTSPASSSDGCHRS